jgi:hypothetical protein
MHLARVAELFFERAGGARLQEFSEPRSRIGESPGRQFDLKSHLSNFVPNTQ